MRHDPYGRLFVCHKDEVGLKLNHIWLINTSTEKHPRKKKLQDGVINEIDNRPLVEEIEKLFAACDKDESPLGLRDKAIIAVAVFAGPRRAELVRIDVSDYSPLDSSIHIRHGKGKKKRHTYLCADGREILEKWIAFLYTIRPRQDGPMFPAFKRNWETAFRNITPESVRIIMEKRSKEAEIPAVKPHDCRRTFITRLLEEGADAFLVQVLAGHERPHTTQRYDKRGMESRKAAVELLNLGRCKSAGEAKDESR